MKRAVMLSLGMSFIMLALVLIAPYLAPPKLVLRFLSKDVYEAGKDHPSPSLLKQLLCHLLLAMAVGYVVWLTRMWQAVRLVLYPVLCAAQAYRLTRNEENG